MAISLRSSTPIAAPPTAAPARPAASSAAPPQRWPEVAGTNLLFGAFLLLIFLEYTGLASQIPPLRVTKFTTLLALGLVVSVTMKVPRLDLFQYTQTRLLAGFAFMTACSVLYALVRSHALYAVQIHVGYFAFFVIALYLLDRPARLMRLSVVFVIVSIVLVVSNLDKLSSSLRVGMFRAAYFLGDGNDFAWGLVVILPLPLYCMRGHAAKLTRVLGLIGAVTCMFGIMATQSRGAAFAVGAGALYHWLAISRRKTVGVVIMVVLLMGAMAAAPGYYLERLKTVPPSCRCRR